MARTWDELLATGAASAPEPTDSTPAEAETEASAGFFKRLRENMGKTRQALGAELRATVFDTLDDAAFERVEEILIGADVGAKTTAEVVGKLEDEAANGELAPGEPLIERLRELLADAARTERADTIDLSERPTVVLVVGVNGTGKTTTIGKLAWHLREHGLSVLVAAADTFRAAAGEQLERWAERAEVDIVRGAEGGDPGAIVFDAIEAARARGVDVVLCDTAGRLHTQQHLMDELRKIRKVIVKQIPEAPHETLLVVDGTTGQNGLRQALLFEDAVDVTGVALTKLDGSAKGGVALAIASELGVPVKLIGIGEGIEDLRPFDPDDFARAIIG